MKSCEAPIISALSYEGLTAVTADGRPATFALLDEHGKVIDAGNHIAKAAWKTSINAYRKFLMGQGHLRVYTRSDAPYLRDSVEEESNGAPSGSD